MLSSLFVTKHLKGSYGYAQPCKRGEVYVYNDSSLYVYRKPDNLKEFKSYLKCYFAGNYRLFADVRGKYPTYYVD